MPLKPLAQPKPRKKRYLDLFCGDGVRLRGMSGQSQFRGWKFIGIDLKKQKKPAGHSNLMFVSGNALKKLQKIPENSIDVINFDYLLGSFKSKHERSGTFDTAYNPELEKQDLSHKTQRILFLARKALVSGGTLYISDYYRNIFSIIEWAEQAGFKLSGRWWITREKDAKSTDLKKNLEEMTLFRSFAEQGFQHPEQNKLAKTILSRRQPVRLMFVKK
ncbi:MAG: hypothetical protein ABIH20_02085 [Candidatus Diapherotrites archaeon]